MLNVLFLLHQHFFHKLGQVDKFDHLAGTELIALQEQIFWSFEGKDHQQNYCLDSEAHKRDAEHHRPKGLARQVSCNLFTTVIGQEGNQISSAKVQLQEGPQTPPDFSWSQLLDHQRTNRAEETYAEALNQPRCDESIEVRNEGKPSHHNGNSIHQEQTFSASLNKYLRDKRLIKIELNIAPKNPPTGMHPLSSPWAIPELISE